MEKLANGLVVLPVPVAIASASASFASLCGHQKACNDGTSIIRAGFYPASENPSDFLMNLTSFGPVIDGFGNDRLLLFRSLSLAIPKQVYELLRKLFTT